MTDEIPEGTTLAEGVARMRSGRSSGSDWIEDQVAEEGLDDQEEVRDALNIGSDVDPLDAFLDVDRSAVTTTTVRIPRLDTSVTVKAIIDSRKHERMVKQCQKQYKVRGQRREELDAPKLAKMIVAEYTVWPPFRKGHGEDEDQAFEKMSQKYGVSIPEILVERALYPGEIEKLADSILEISGFDTERELAKK